MDGGDALHVAGGGAQQQRRRQENTIVNNNRVMLRFRPIAPKPSPGSTFSGERSAVAMNNNSLYAPKKNTKKKYVRTKKNNNTRSSSSSTTTTTVTLQLLPEEPGDFSGGRSWLPSNLSYIDQTVEKKTPDLVVAMQGLKGLTQLTGKTEFLAAGGSDRRTAAAAESWVTVESVDTSTDTCMDLQGLLGCTDEERVRSLEKDTCPGFVSDGYNKVVWVNEAYKKMVGPPEEVVMRVWLVAKAELPPSSSAAAAAGFSCMARLQYTWRRKEEKMVPCDVWRLKEREGWLAWRLDVKAALSLGL